MNYSTLETKDLILRKAVVDDYSSLFENFWSDETSAKYMLWRVAKDLEEAKIRLMKIIAYQEKYPYTYCICEKKSNSTIGLVGFTETENKTFEDSGLGVGSRFFHKGYGTQVLHTMLKILFESGAKNVVYSTFSDNENSVKLIKKFGFKKQSEKEFVSPKDGKTYLVEVYGLTKEDYEREKHV